MLNSKSLKVRLIFLCVILSMVTLLVGGMGYFNLNQVASQYEHVGATNLPRSLSANGLLSGLRRIRIAMRTIALVGNSEQEADDAIEKGVESLASFEATLKEYEASEYAHGVQFGPGEKELFDDVVLKWKAFKEVSEKVVELYRDKTPENEKEIIQIYHDKDPNTAKICAAAIEKLIAYQSNEAKKWVAQAQSAANRATWVVFLAMLIGLSTCMLIGFKFATSLSNRISDISRELSLGTNRVSEIANQVALVSDTLSQNTSKQAETIQETSSSIEETSSMIAKNADNAKSSSDVSKHSQSSVIDARNSVSEMINAIQGISESNQRIVDQIHVSNQEIADIVKVIAEIGDKTKVIHDIVFQTKLLSFNASVEAARAGEHGRGFAVVAEEVGNLAAMSGRSAAEISGLLDKSILKVKETIEKSTSSINGLMTVSIDKIKEGSKSAKHCDEILNEVVRQVSEVNSCVEEIAVASEEQSKGVQEVNKAIVELEKASQSNHATSVETSQTAEKLKDQVVELRSLVQNLNQAVMGSQAPEQHHQHDGSIVSASDEAHHHSDDLDLAS